MTREQRAQIERAIEEYMTLFDQYMDESDETIIRQLKAQMEAVERKYGIPAGYTA